MRIITVSREFGSGGRELGKRLSDILGMDYYDGEILSAVAKRSGLDLEYVKSLLGDHGWQNFPISYGGTLRSQAYAGSAMVEALVEQKNVIESIARMGNDFVVVGRNADVILSEYDCFNIFVCADVGKKAERIMERAREGEKLTKKEAMRQMKRVDAQRARTRQILTDSPWGEPGAYCLTVNTTGWSIKELAPAVADYALRWFGRAK